MWQLVNNPALSTKDVEGVISCQEEEKSLTDIEIVTKSTKDRSVKKQEREVSYCPTKKTSTINNKENKVIINNKLLQKSKTIRKQQQQAIVLTSRIEELDREIAIAKQTLEDCLNSIEKININELKQEVETREQYLAELQQEIDYYNQSEDTLSFFELTGIEPSSEVLTTEEFDQMLINIKGNRKSLCDVVSAVKELQENHKQLFTVAQSVDLENLQGLCIHRQELEQILNNEEVIERANDLGYTFTDEDILDNESFQKLINSTKQSLSDVDNENEFQQICQELHWICPVINYKQYGQLSIILSRFIESKTSI